MSPLVARLIRVVAAACLAVSGYVHAYLYDNGYRVIPRIGVAFLLQASASIAVAVLLPFTGLVLLRLAAAGLAGGALVAFTMSRTIGVLGFEEHGLQPAPQALLSVVVEVSALLALAVPVVLRMTPAQQRRPVPSAASTPR